MPRKKLADPVTLSVVFEPDDGGWHVYVPSLQGCRTWGRSLTEARRNIREAISLQAEAFNDADAVARDAIFEEDIRVDDGVRALLEMSEVAKAAAEAEAAQARAFSAAAARALTEAQLSLRDAGELLGLSQEGVRKILKTPKVLLDTNAVMDFTVQLRSGVAYYQVKRTQPSEYVKHKVSKGDVPTSRWVLRGPATARATSTEVVPKPAVARSSRSTRRARSAHGGKGS